MSAYQDYANGMRAFSDIAFTVSLQKLDEVNKEANKVFNSICEDGLKLVADNYETSVNQRISYYNTQIAKDNASSDMIADAIKQRDRLQSNLNNFNTYRDALDNGDDVSTHMQRYSFGTREELFHFTIEMDNRGAFGYAVPMRENGQYVYVSISENKDEIADYSKGIPIRQYESFSNETPHGNAYDIGASGFTSPFDLSMASTEAGHVQYKIATTATNINFFLSNNPFKDASTKQLQMAWAEKAQAGYYKTIHEGAHHVADTDVDFLLESAKNNSVTFKYGSYNDFGRDVGRLQTEILKKAKSLPTWDKKGKFDLASFSKLSETDLKLVGLTENDRQVLLKTFAEGSNDHIIFNKVVSMVGRTAGREDIKLLQDGAHGYQRGRQIYKTGKASVQYSRQRLNNIHAQMLKKAQKKGLQTRKPQTLKTKPVSGSMPHKVQTKLATRQEKYIHTKENKIAKQINDKARKNVARKTFVSNLYERAINTKIGLALKRVTDPFVAIKKEVSKKILVPVATVIFKLMVFCAGFMVIIIIIIAIGSLLDGQDYKDTVAYKLEACLEKKEEKWIKDLVEVSTDTEKGFFNWSTIANDWNSILYTQDYISGEEYVNQVDLLESNEGKLYVNIFDFEPADEDAKKQIKVFDGGTTLSIIPYDSSAHTNNIKEILCMADVWFELDMDGNASLSDTKSEMRKVGRENQKEAKKSKSEAGLDEDDEYYSEDNYATWGRLKDYAVQLYNMSHQECYEMEVLVFPCKEEGKEKYATLQEYPSEEGYYSSSTIVKECPDADKGGCLECESIRYYYDPLKGRYDVVGLKGTDDKMHYVGDIVTLENEMEGGEPEDKCYPVPSNPEETFNRAKGSDCWEELGTIEDTEWSYAESKEWWDSLENTYEFNHYADDDIEVSAVEYIKDVQYDMVAGMTRRDEDAVYRYKKIESSYKWNCQGHKGRYCGGHVRLNTKGLVYSFTEQQMDAVSGEGFYADSELEGKIDFNDIDYSSISSAEATGLNVTSESKDVLYTDNIPSCDDIYDVDMNIHYSESNSLLSENYRLFDTTWDESNMELATLKYVQDWNDMYEFDIGNNLGGICTLTDDQIDEIIKKNTYSMSDEQKELLRTVLKCVGNGTYDYDSHEECYREKSPYNVKADASAFVGYVLAESGKYSYGVGNAPTMEDLIGLAGGGNLNPCDILIHVDEENGSNALVYCGSLSGDVELSNGIVISAGSPILVDCNVFSDRGNIYMHFDGSSFSIPDYIGDCSVIALF